MTTIPPPKPKTNITPKPQKSTQKTKQNNKNDELLKTLSEEVRTLTRRVRDIEDQISLVRKKIDVFNQNMLTTFKKDRGIIDRQKAEIEQFRVNMIELQELMSKLVKDLNSFAKKDEVMRLEKYIDFWHPIKFVTYDGLERMVKKQVNEKVEDINLKLQIEEFVKERMKAATAKFIHDLKTGKIKIKESKTK